MSIAKFIKQNAKFFSQISYDRTRYGWDFSNWTTSIKQPGIYFIVMNINGILDILKIGKAEGQNGLYQRFSYYKSSAVNRVESDRTIFPLHNAMLDVEKKYGKNCKMELHIMPIEKTLVEMHGFTVEASVIRSLELQLSIAAKNEGHSMLLSGQD